MVGGVVAGAALAGCIGTASAEGLPKLPPGVRTAALTLGMPPAHAASDPQAVHHIVRNAPAPVAAAIGPAQPLAAAVAAAAQKPAAAVPGPKLAPKPAAVHAVPKLITAADLIALAKKQVGISSGDKFTTWFAKTPRAKQTVARDGGSVGDYVGAEWCDMFVSWLGGQLGISNTLGADPWTVAHAKWFQSQHRWGTTPKPGAVVFFSWSGGKTADDINHVGIVVKDNHNGTIQTIEGNTGGGQVLQQTRDTSEVVGYGYPAYAA